MAPRSDRDDQNDAASSPPLTDEKPTTAKRQQLTTSTETDQQTLTSPSSPPSSSIPRMPPVNSLHAPPVPTLPFELIIEILRWIPVKFIMQLRCVCKSWKSLISDPEFAKKHLRESPTVTNLVLSFVAKRSREFSLQACPLPSVFDDVTVNATQLRYPLETRRRFDLIVASCDGVICFATDQSYALLWNPSIGKFKKLPSLENQRREGSYTIYGFGYDRFTDSYKVVAIFCYECDSGGAFYETQVKVLTLGTDAWRRIQEFPPGVPFDESGKFVSGTINWLASTNSSSLWVIVSLDLGKETYQELLQPDYGGVAVVTLTLGVLRDCLCILSHCDTFSDVWLMKEYGNKDSWNKLFSVPYMGNPDFFPYTKALWISNDDKVLLEFQSKLVVYDSRNGTFKFPEIQNVNGWMIPEVYVESLISPCS
ncbi:F-box/kelch-repeat protein At3g23880-like [Abrus precatorius]|uniref:F-box/kelch-repeat protein At3g23880-like n=1 Tax=Abrus precatorius TaxID=3816 RepID=A0A8B8L8R1_ABRPR|nr:F-box/kelch-repeat protein At3g23880-like [Abrus precatorius]